MYQFRYTYNLKSDQKICAKRYTTYYLLSAASWFSRILVNLRLKLPAEHRSCAAGEKRGEEKQGPGSPMLTTTTRRRFPLLFVESVNYATAIIYIYSFFFLLLMSE